MNWYVFVDFTIHTEQGRPKCKVILLYFIGFNLVWKSLIKCIHMLIFTKKWLAPWVTILPRAYSTHLLTCKNFSFLDPSI